MTSKRNSRRSRARGTNCRETSLRLKSKLNRLSKSKSSVKKL